MCRSFCKIALLTLITASVTACSAGLKKQRSAVYWPKPPEQARYVYETSLRSEADITKLSRGELFRRTVVGEDPKQKLAFIKPFDVAARQGRVIVSDTMANSVTLFDIPRRQVMHFGRSVEGRLRKPLGVTIDDALQFYVADSEARQVVVYNATGHFIKRIGEPGQLTRPVDVAVSPAGDRLFVVDTGGLSSNDHRVVVYSGEGELLTQFGSRGTAPGEFNLPVAIAYGPDDAVYVLDAGNFRVQVFTAAGEFIRAWGEVGRGLGNFARPRGLAIDPDGNIYVTDAAYRNFQIFTPEGRLLMWIGGEGLKDEPGQYVLPAGIAVDESRRVYIVDQLFTKVDVIRQLPMAQPNDPAVPPASADVGQPDAGMHAVQESPAVSVESAEETPAPVAGGSPAVPAEGAAAGVETTVIVDEQKERMDAAAKDTPAGDSDLGQVSPVSGVGVGEIDSGEVSGGTGNKDAVIANLPDENGVRGAQQEAAGDDGQLLSSP